MYLQVDQTIQLGQGLKKKKYMIKCMYAFTDIYMLYDC